MVNPFIHLSKAQKQAKLTQLACVWERLISGESEVQIDDEGRVGVRYAKADISRLEGLICQLQSDLGLLANSSASRRPITLGFR